MFPKTESDWCALFLHSSILDSNLAGVEVFILLCCKLPGSGCVTACLFN